MNKITVRRKDGIVYERKPGRCNKCLCIRIDDERFDKLKKYGKPSKIIKSLIDEYLERENNEKPRDI